MPVIEEQLKQEATKYKEKWFAKVVTFEGGADMATPYVA